MLRYKFFAKGPQIFHFTEAEKTLLNGFLNVDTLIFEFEKKCLENSFELVWSPVEVLHFHNKDGLEGVDCLLS